MKVVVNTPAGKIGRFVADQLLGDGHEVVVISRHPEKCASLTARGASLMEGSIDDPALLDRAFAGARALFWVTPLSFDQHDYADWAAQLAQKAANAALNRDVNKVVMISSIGVQHDRGVGPIIGCRAAEIAFAKAVPNVCALRAGSFMENFLTDVPTIAVMGAIFTAHSSDRAIPMVATKDIAAVAVQALTDGSWGGFRVTGVHGPEDLSHAAAARIIGEAIGKPVRHVEVSLEDAHQAMIAQALPAKVAELIMEMYRGFRDGRIVPAEPRSSQTTTPTTLYEFAAEVLRPAVLATANALSR